jgi:hypothetical protein
MHVTREDINAWLYWIRRLDMDDIHRQGYVGLTSVGISHRFTQHRELMKTRQYYHPEFISTVEDGKYIVETVSFDKIETIRRLERELRPKINIGWNRAVGGDGGFNHKHGMTGSLAAKRYYNMLTRASQYGLIVGDEWLGSDGLMTFYDDMGNPPTPRHELIRRDYDEGYFFENCKWAKREDYMTTMRHCGNVQYEGKLYTYKALGEKLGIKGNTIQTRLKRGWTFEEATNQVARAVHE